MKRTTLALLALTINVSAQNVVQNPIATQTITQPSGTNLNVNRFQQIKYADQFSGSDIGAKVNAAIADLPSTGGIVEIPAGSYSFSTGISISKSDVWVRCQGWGAALLYTPTTGTAVTIGATGGVTGSRFSDCTLRGSGHGTGVYV